MKATIDASLCIGCGLCVSDCPEVFAMNDDSTIAEVIVDTVPAVQKEGCRNAATNCPVEAIHLSE